ncbi:MAG TPA: Tad domain-containing protein [Armatimonadota bacterium]
MENIRHQRRAYVLVQVVLVLVVLMAFVALSVDYGTMVIRQRRLQNVTDSAALAGGPDIGKKNAPAVQVALDYAGYNNAPTATASEANWALTVDATEDVATPFAHVLNSAWGTRPVSARSVVQASADLTGIANLLRPFALMAGQAGPSGADKYLAWNGWDANLKLVLDAQGNGYSNNYGVSTSGTTVTIEIAPLDLNGSGISAKADVTTAVNAYIAGLKGDPPAVAYKLAGNTYWLASLLFVANDKSFTWANDLAAWKAATARAICRVADGGDTDSVLERVLTKEAQLGRIFPNRNDPGWPDEQDPRLCVFVECNRLTGSGQKSFDTALQGYVGFFITGMSADKSMVTGYIVDPVMRSRVLQTGTSTVPDGTNYGIRSFYLAQ